MASNMNNTANDGVTGMGSNKNNLGETGYGGGNNNNMNTGTGAGTTDFAGPNTGAGYGGTTGAGQYGAGGVGATGVQQGPFGAGTGTEVRENDKIAAPIDWDAINAPRTGGAGHFGLTGRAGEGGGIGQPANEDLSLADDQRFDAGSGNTHTGRHMAEGAAVGGVGGHELNQYDNRTGGTGGHHVARDAAIGGVGAAGVDHEYNKHERNQAGGGGMQQQQFDNSGFQQNDNTHPNAGRHGAEAGALAGGVGGHQGGHTVRDAAVGGAAGGAAGHEVHKHDENKTGTNEDQSGQKPGLMAKVKEIFKPHQGNDAANPGAGGGVVNPAGASGPVGGGGMTNAGGTTGAAGTGSY